MGARRIATLAAAACLLFCASAQAAPPPPPLVANGDFESSTLSPWSPYAGNVRLADQTDWTAASGKQSVELSGYGRIYQDIYTTPWQRYDLSFAYAANPSAGCSGAKTLDVSWSGGLPSETGNGGSFSFDPAGHTTTSMGWQNAHLLVEATNYITGLAFGDDNAPAGCGVVIDNVVMGAASTTQTGTQLVAPSTVLGEPATLTATVLGSSAAVTPTGSVQFAVDGTAAGAPVALANGQAQKTLEGLARGTHTVTAVYTSDSVSFDSSSVMGRVTVRQARTATNVSADPSPVALGQWTTITAEVGVLAPRAGAPTGSVQFADEYGPVGDPVPIDAAGIAQIALLEDLGDRSLYAYYSGDDDFTSSVGSTQLSVFDANPAPAPPSTGGTKIATTTALVSSKNPIEPGESYTVTATVSPGAAGDAVLDGTIAFTINGVAAGDPIALDGNRSASVTITPPPGVTRQTVRARYSGNASFLSSTGFLGERIVPPFGAVIRPTNPPPDTHAPVFTLRITPTRLAQALRHGVRVHVDCDENCSASLRLVLTARRAKALGMRVRGKTVLVAQGRYEFADRKASDIVVRFTARARKALAKAKRVPLRLRTTASDLTGNDAVRVQRFTLKR